MLSLGSDDTHSVSVRLGKLENCIRKRIRLIAKTAKITTTTTNQRIGSVASKSRATRSISTVATIATVQVQSADTNQAVTCRTNGAATRCIPTIASCCITTSGYIGQKSSLGSSLVRLDLTNRGKFTISLRYKWSLRLLFTFASSL